MCLSDSKLKLGASVNSNQSNGLNETFRSMAVLEEYTRDCNEGEEEECCVLSVVLPDESTVFLEGNCCHDPGKCWGHISASGTRTMKLKKPQKVIRNGCSCSFFSALHERKTKLMMLINQT